MTTWTIGVASGMQVTGYNSENADYDRPRGEIIEEVFYLSAEDREGNRRAFGSFLTRELAQKAILTAPPVDSWTDIQPAYGSLAYEQYGQADDIESERRHDDADMAGFDTRFSIF